MTAYKISNLDFNTPSADKAKLEMALKAIQCVRTVSLSVPRKEFKFTWTGTEPSIDVLKAACVSAGFTLSRKA